MKLHLKQESENGIITVSVMAEELGDTQYSAEEELNFLHNFPEYIEYKDIDFSANMMISGKDFIITSESPNGTTIEEVTFPNLINRKYLLDEDFAVSLEIDISKISNEELGTVFNTKKKLGKARAILFASKIQEAVEGKMKKIRESEDDNFEKTTSVIL